VKLIAFDPGFDVTGWAIFNPCRPPDTLQSAVGALSECGEIRTELGDSHPQRISHLGSQVHFLLTIHNPDFVVLELPAYEGDYGNDRRRRPGVNKLYMAIGAIMAHTHGERVVTVKAPGQAKSFRHELLASAARMAEVELPEGPRGGVREDAWDAVWAGCSVLLEKGPLIFGAGGVRGQ